MPTITGDASANTLVGGLGDDSVSGLDGNDLLVDGDAGNDTLSGGNGNDTLDYRSGSLTAADVADGGAGFDQLMLLPTYGDGGSLTVTLGPNTVSNIEQIFLSLFLPGPNLPAFIDHYSLTLDDVTVAAGQTLQILSSGAFINPSSTLFLDDSSESDGNMSFSSGGGLETIIAGAGNDTITGGSGIDSIQGGAGDDSLTGGSGNDTLIAGAGNDTVDGGAGNDSLDGGVGTDALTYASDTGGVNVDLGAGTASGLLTGSDTLAGIENITGGSGNDTLIGDSGDNSIGGHDGNDSLSGNDGADTISGDNGADTVFGGNGNDTLNGGVGDDCLYGDAGDDSLIGASGNDTIYGGAGNDTLSGVDGDDLLYGDAGDDLLRGSTENDTLYGGDGNDTLNGNAGSDSLDGGNGTDTANYLTNSGLTGKIVDLGIAGSQLIDPVAGEWETLVSVENLKGSNFEDQLSGDQNDNALTGNDGNDTLEGRAGNDSIDGGNGTDTALFSHLWLDYSITGSGPFTLVDSNLSSSDGADTVTGVENFQFANGTFSATDILNDAPTDIALSSSAIDENAANGTVVGALSRSDADIPLGDTASYSLLDNAGGRFGILGANLVVADGTLLDYELHTSHTVTMRVTDAKGATFDRDFTITVTNVPGVTISGNSSANLVDATHTIVGQPLPTGEEDSINGSSANDTLSSLGGNDTIDGGTGSDSMIGGTGNDLYIVDVAGDKVVENPGEGTDTVQSSVTYTLPANVEALVLTGLNNINGTGNSGGNAITGNSANNILAGLGGADTLDGEAGTDTATYAAAPSGVNVSLTTGFGSGGDAQGDVLSNIENVTGSAFNDTIEGTDANNVLAGGAGTDTVSYLHAGAGVTVSLAVTTAQNTVGAGTDTLTQFENLTGSAFNDSLSGSSAANILDGGSGDDTMAGAGGNDTYFVDSAGDQVIESAGAGTDTVFTTLNALTLTANVESLTFTGAGDFDGTGNVLANSITGGNGNDSLTGLAGNNTLDGGTGSDTMVGGANNDTYKVDNIGDVTVEAAGAGTDTVLTTLNALTLGANLENLTFAGVGDFTGAGNGLNNDLIGGSGNDVLTDGNGNDTLNGGGGNDTLAGGAGNDTYFVDSTGDIVTEAAGAGTDTVKTTVASYTLGANIENLTFTGAGDFAGTGNDIANTMTGGAGDDMLDGGIGNDKVLGAAGNDQLLGGAGNDSITGGAGADTVTGGAGADRFIFATPTDFASGAVLDTIADFSHAQADRIDLSSVDANTALAGNQAFTFVGMAAFSLTAGELHYVANGPDLIVSADTDGDGNADFAFTVSNAGSLVAADFLL